MARYYVTYQIAADVFSATDGAGFCLKCASEEQAGDLVEMLNNADVATGDVEGLHGVVLNLVSHITLLQTRVAHLDVKVARILRRRAS